jgi:signal transduction histidine kinase
MMLVVSAVTAAGLAFAQRSAALAARRGFRAEFQAMLAASQAVEDVRDAALAERCRALARRPRIHAALEDGAPDLLYPSAQDEMADIMDEAREGAGYALHARFYRFLDSKGRVITPPEPGTAGELAPGEEARLTLRALPQAAQKGYLARGADGDVDELVAMPIVSSESGETISAVVVGFGTSWGAGADTGIRSGMWLAGRLAFPSLGGAARDALSGAVARAVAVGPAEGSLEAAAGGAAYLVFYKLLNPGSSFPRAYEVSLCPLGGLEERQRRLLWQFGGAGALLLAGGFLASRAVSGRLSRPVERLAQDSEENRAHWHEAEAALELTSRELQRSARFSADASHQLKTPVTVIRSGLEELLAGEHLRPEAREEVSGLVHQTFRLASIIEDLLLLSRMDAGRLQIQFGRVDLGPLVEALVDDLSAMPGSLALKVEAEVAPVLWVTGEKRFLSLILQNLLENARKYNRAGGRIRIRSHADGEWAVVLIGNTGAPIPPASQDHVFERFHRGAVGENLPGHGIGLNLARDLARLHGGSLRLASSGGDWTEFELRLRQAPPAPP